MRLRYRIVAAASLLGWTSQTVLADEPITVSNGGSAVNVSTAGAGAAVKAFLTGDPVSVVRATKTADPASLRSAVLSGNFASPVPNTARQSCPGSCSNGGFDPTSWFAYHSVNRLSLCNQPMLLDFALFNPLDDPATSVSIAACTADLNEETSSKLSNTTCQAPSVNQTTITSNLQLSSSGSSSPGQVSNAATLLDQLRAASVLEQNSCNQTINIAMYNGVAIGVYVGSGLTSQGVITSVLDKVKAQIQSDGGLSEELAVQLCDDRSARYTLGVYATTHADLATVQRGLQSWANGTCVTSLDKTNPTWAKLSFLAPTNSTSSGHNSTSTSASSSTGSSRSETSSTVSTSGSGHSKLVSSSSGRSGASSGSIAVASSSVSSSAPSHSHTSQPLIPRADCRTEQVAAGDSCGSLATECGITPAQFTQYNSQANLCSTLTPGQYVCCSSGTLPDMTPKPYSNGTCNTYLVKSGDSCSSLAAANQLTNAKIESFNANTWGWTGCTNLLAGYVICLSSGYPPMPTNVANAVCGPQVNNTAVAPPGTDLTKLNECPLNACCDIWGQCGTTTEFCTISNSSTGAPGTAAPGQNGCISNCGTDIIESSAPAQQFSIAYFEAFDWQRPCLHMNVEQIDTTKYTHVHFAFATLNSDFSVNVDDVKSQLPLLQGMTGIKRIVSFGGWTFSTDPSTYTIFRNAVSSQGNRQTLINNIVGFLNEYDLDGVDWDWEYPAEPDIPGIPAGTVQDSIGFYLLLDDLKSAMPAGKTVSVTAPASFWYLQNFPIQAIATVIDYIVYMTYDLHGQWDYGNKFSDPGCPGGNCLRSHVNMTETINSLSMITKAGVPSNMIAVGVTSYGRSFKMTTPGCIGPECTFTGPASGSWAGPCTNTPGYLANWEIDQIASSNPSAQVLWDADSYSNIVVFNQTEWVAFMNDSNKAFRKQLYPELNFLGTADWAVDLQSPDGDGSDAGSGSGSGSGSGPSTVYINPTIWSEPTPAVTAMPGATLIWPPMPLHSTTTITFPLLTTTLTYSTATEVTTVTSGTTSSYYSLEYFTYFTVLTIPPVTTTAIPVWAVTLGNDSTTGTIQLTSSVQPSSFEVTITPVISGTTSIIGATQTTTTTGAAAVWSGLTYVQPTQTETLGGRTTIIGGITLPPTSIPVTPNPYPTTVPKSPDPVINPKPPKWTSGGPPAPTSPPGCPGCGSPCILFCDPGCPFCPPNVFGGGGGSGEGDDGDDNESSTRSSSTTSSQPTTTYSVYEDVGYIDDVYPTAFAGAGDISAISSEAMSAIATLRSTVVITSTTTVIPTTTVTVTPTPQADCAFWDEGWGWTFEVYNIQDWSTDGGKALNKQEHGCGALTGWEYTDATSTSFAYTYFNLPFFIKDGCVERAIVSAGGPKISCQGQGFGKKKRGEAHRRREVLPRSVIPQPAAAPMFNKSQILEYKSFYSNQTAPDPTYAPANWGANATSTVSSASLTSAKTATLKTTKAKTSTAKSTSRGA